MTPEEFEAEQRERARQTEEYREEHRLREQMRSQPTWSIHPSEDRDA